MGQPVRPARTANCSGAAHAGRYCRCKSCHDLVRLLVSRVSQRTRYLNAVNTFKELLSLGVVPIVNENDTVSVSVSFARVFALEFSHLYRK